VIFCQYFLGQKSVIISPKSDVFIYFGLHWTSRYIHKHQIRHPLLSNKNWQYSRIANFENQGGINFRENSWLNNAVRFPLTAFFLGCVRSQITYYPHHLISTLFISHKISPDLWILREVQCISNSFKFRSTFWEFGPQWKIFEKFTLICQLFSWLLFQF
jgi:hypothetical protein